MVNLEQESWCGSAIPAKAGGPKLCAGPARNLLKARLDASHFVMFYFCSFLSIAVSRDTFMHDITAGAGFIQIFIHNDGHTPLEFVKNLMREVFGKSENEAIAFTALIEAQDRMACGTYPPPVATALIETARELIEIFGHPLQITSRANSANGPCALCGALGAEREIYRADKAAYLCSDCVLTVRHASEELPGDEFRYAYVALDWHFAGTPRHQLVTRSREFPGHMRPDVQVAVDKLFGSPLHFFGIHEEYRYETRGFRA
jgi:ATP-dependent Clp protease adapter protein ClpS